MKLFLGVNSARNSALQEVMFMNELAEMVRMLIRAPVFLWHRFPPIIMVQWKMGVSPI